MLYLCVSLLGLSSWISVSRGQDLVGGGGPPPPIEELDYEFDLCSDFHSCQAGDELVTGATSKGCYCDDMCSVYADCCPNADVDNRSHDGTLDWLRDFSTCQSGATRRDLELIDVDYDYFMVASCPAHYADVTVKNQCVSHADSMDPSDVILKVPVSSQRHGIIFKNIFCALCHGFSMQEVQFWKVGVKCDTDILESGSGDVVVTTEQMQGMRDLSVVEVLMSKGLCMYNYTAPAQVALPRGCLNVISTCADNWQDPAVARNCSQDGFQVVTFIDMYRNKYCARCNFFNSYSCVPKLKDRKSGGFGSDSGLLAGHYVGLSVLLDFNSGMHDIREHRDSARFLQCGEGELYDMLKATCRQLSCSPGYTLFDNECRSKMNETVCPMIKLEDHEYALFDNGSLYVNESGHVIEAGNYSWQNGSILVCSTDYNEGYLEGSYEFDMAQGMISLVGQIISILSLAVLLMVYGFFAELQNIHGRCLMFLSAALLGAQLCFVIGSFITDVLILCQIFAICTHFFFLVAFCWMNTMAFNVWRTFSKFRKSSEKKRRIWLYCSYCGLVPAAIVICAIVLDLTRNSQLNPHYGQAFCWISDKRALFYLFVLPVFILIGSNCLFFSLSIYHICSSSMASGSVLRQDKESERRKRILIYAKLSTIMGLTWVFGFAASLCDIRALWYLFIIFNSLQGLFICLAFLCNKKVYKLVRGQAERYSQAWTSTANTRSTSVSMDMYKTQPEQEKLYKQEMPQDCRQENGEGQEKHRLHQHV